VGVAYRDKLSVSLCAFFVRRFTLSQTTVLCYSLLVLSTVFCITTRALVGAANKSDAEAN
jgi:hypothetical protein